MRLVSLSPHWVAISRWDDAGGTQHYYDKPPRRGGLSFECPVHTRYCGTCGQCVKGSHRIVVWFENPVDGLPPEFNAPHRWARVGEEFDCITLTPSINVQVADPTCWHGHIIEGEVQ